MLVFDCETRTDKAQALTFGSYRFLVEGRCLKRVCSTATICPHASEPSWNATRASHAADTDPRGIPERSIPSNPNSAAIGRGVSRAALPRGVQRPRAARRVQLPVRHLALGTGLPAFAGPLPRRLQLRVLPVPGRERHMRPNPYRPAITVKHMDGKRAFKRFTATIDRDKEDRYPKEPRAQSRTIVTSSAGTCSMPKP